VTFISCGVVHNEVADEDDGVVFVQTDEDWDKSRPATPVANLPTPPSTSVETIQDPFTSLLNFGDEGNPWIS